MDLNARHFNGPTNRSVKFMMDLFHDKDYSVMESEMPEVWRSLLNQVTSMAYTDQDGHRTTSAIIQQPDVSKFIDQLKKCPAKLKDPKTSGPMSKAEQEQAAIYQAGTFPPGSEPVRKVVTEDGMYRHGTDIYKVQMAVHGSGKLYAKKLVQVDTDSTKGGVPKFKFEYAPGAMRLLNSDNKLALADAMEFGRLYGACCVCGRTLTNELSIHLGIGPVCGGREFGGEFEFLVNNAKLKLGMPVKNPASKVTEAADVSDFDGYTAEDADEIKAKLAAMDAEINR